LCWGVWFPQTLRWYVETFCSDTKDQGDSLDQDKTREQAGLDAAARLIILVGLLIPAIVTALALVLDLLLLPGRWGAVSWSAVAVGSFIGIVGGVVLGLGISLVRGAAMGFSLGVGIAIAAGVGFGVGLGVAVGLPYAVVCGAVGGAAFGLPYGWTFNVAMGVTSGGVSKSESGATLTAVCLGAFGVTSGVGLALLSGVLLTPSFGSAFAVVALTLMLRPGGWVLGSVAMRTTTHGTHWWPICVSPLPLPGLASRIVAWLNIDRQQAVLNINELTTFTMQQLPASAAIRQNLEGITGNGVIPATSQFLEDLRDWDLLRLATAPVGYTLKSMLPPLLTISRSQTGRLEFGWFELNVTPDSTPVKATVSGFLRLYDRRPNRAVQVFENVQDVQGGPEMRDLSQTLLVCAAAESPTGIAALDLPDTPGEAVRPSAWQAVGRLKDVVRDVATVQHAASRAARAVALNRALGTLTNLIENTDRLPGAECGILCGIADRWRGLLLSVADKATEAEDMKPVINPYVVGDPVVGPRFVGREEVMRKLEDLWIVGAHIQSVVLYGHRRTGKTSILRNMDERLGAGVRVAYVNLLQTSDVADVILAICDAVSTAIESVTSPPDAELLDHPYAGLRRFLLLAAREIGEDDGLVIALDEFEKLEILIRRGKIPEDFLEFLRGLVQMAPRIGFAFAGLHTLEEMTADYFHPFFGSVVPIPIGFLSLAAAKEVLANPPTDEFLLTYDDDALHSIHCLTSGQPYLVQLIGFHLVQRYNESVFQAATDHEPVLTLDNVRAVAESEELYRQGRYYFAGVWEQSTRGRSEQEKLLECLAAEPEGIELSSIARQIKRPEKDVLVDLRILKRYDVVWEQEGRWRVLVELFRRWIARRCESVGV